MKRKTAKQLVKAKLKAELKEIKVRAKELKNPFVKYMAVLDKAPKIFDLALNLGLAAASFKALGVTEKVVTVKHKEQVGSYEKVEVVGPPLAGVTPYPWAHGTRTPENYYKREYPESSLKRTQVPIYREWETQEKRTEYNPLAALYGPVALKLAQSDNIASGVSGVIGLSVLGLASSAGSVDNLLRGVDPLLALQDAWAVITGAKPVK